MIENSENARSNLHWLLDEYQSITGEGVRIARQFIQDIKDGYVDPSSYFKSELGDQCGCFHHSALKALNKREEVIEMFDADYFYQESAINDLFGCDTDTPLASIAANPFESWLYAFKDDYKREEAAELATEWTQEWINANSGS